MTTTDKDIIRTVHLRPYRKGMGPTFTLVLWDCHRTHRGGPQWQLGYRLTMRENGRTIVLFEGEDYGCSPCHAIDSNASVEGILGFLTLRPGDTDAEYFEGYTDVQRAFAEQHAESLGCEARYRFGEV